MRDKNVMEKIELFNLIKFYLKISIHYMLKISAAKLVDLIDTESPVKIRNDYHLLFDNGILYVCTLNQTDLVQNSNKFHIMQLLKHNKLDTYCLYSRGGRVGYAGQWNCELYQKRDIALADWENKFYEKTGHSWVNRDSIVIVQPGKYDYIAMKYLDDAIENLENLDPSPEIVPKPKIIMDIDTELLMKLIWDPEVFKNAMEDVRIDSKRMPLGKISKKQIDKATEILNKIQEYLDEISATTTPVLGTTASNSDLGKEQVKEIKRLSGQFYTIIPYACGMAAPPAIKDCDALKEKAEQLKLLEELLVVKEKLDKGDLDIQQKYLTLNCDIKAVTDPTIISLIRNYVNKTSGSTHHFKIKINKIYEISRVGETERFAKFESMSNHQLLFHGSRLANFVSILSNGLRINPSSTVVRTGAMFGSAAIYFSNASTKSANYTGDSKNCLMLLAEVALGNTYNLTHGQHITKLPSGLDSTWGLGMYTPDPNSTVMLNDIKVPSGSLIKSNVNNVYLNYDEFIVYNEAQVKLKYLIWVDLNLG